MVHSYSYPEASKLTQLGGRGGHPWVENQHRPKLSRVGDHPPRPPRLAANASLTLASLLYPTQLILDPIHRLLRGATLLVLPIKPPCIIHSSISSLNMDHATCQTLSRRA